MARKQQGDNSEVRERPGKRVADLQNLNLEDVHVNADTIAPARSDVYNILRGTKVSGNSCLNICL